MERCSLLTIAVHPAPSLSVVMLAFIQHIWDLRLPWILQEEGINQILESSVGNNPFNTAPGVFFIRDSKRCAKRWWCSLMELPLECNKEQGTRSSECVAELKAKGLRVHWRTQTGRGAYSTAPGYSEHIISLF